MMAMLILPMYLNALCGLEGGYRDGGQAVSVEEARSKVEAMVSAGGESFRVFEKVSDRERTLDICAKDEAAAVAQVMAAHCDLLVDPVDGKSIKLAEAGFGEEVREGARVRMLRVRVTGGEWRVTRNTGPAGCD